MNYKIARTMLTLCVVYLVGFYILKFIFPNLLVQAITSPTVLKFGEFLNKWVGFSHIINILGTTVGFSSSPFSLLCGAATVSSEPARA